MTRNRRSDIDNPSAQSDIVDDDPANSTHTNIKLPPRGSWQGRHTGLGIILFPELRHRPRFQETRPGVLAARQSSEGIEDQTKFDQRGGDGTGDQACQRHCARSLSGGIVDRIGNGSTSDEEAQEEQYEWNHAHDSKARHSGNRKARRAGAAVAYSKAVSIENVLDGLPIP